MDSSTQSANASNAIKLQFQIKFVTNTPQQKEIYLSIRSIPSITEAITSTFIRYLHWIYRYGDIQERAVYWDSRDCLIKMLNALMSVQPDQSQTLENNPITARKPDQKRL